MARRALVCGWLRAAAALAAAWAAWAGMAPASHAGAVRLGVLYSLTGPFAPSGALAGFRGTKIAIDMANERGGIAGRYRVEYVSVDAQSNPDIAIREAQRLISVERVPAIVGVYSSSIAVPLAGIADRSRTVLWVTIAISDAVVRDKHYRYVFRPTVPAFRYGETSVQFIRDVAQERLGVPVQQVRFAVVYEDGPYGTSTAERNVDVLRELGIQPVLRQAYSSRSTDLSSLVLQLRAARPDIILHTGYFPDTVLLLRQARELGLKFKGILGHGAGYANLAGLAEALGKEGGNYLFNIDPPAAQIINPRQLAPGIPELIREFLSRYEREFGDANPPAHATMGFAHTWVLLQHVLPRALQLAGQITADSIRQAALELDLPDGSTPIGYGVRFAAPEDEWSGQNVRARPVVMQWVNGQLRLVYPFAMAGAPPVLPYPSDSPYAP